MSDQPLIDYQLKLQADEHELREFRKGGEATRAALARNGVPDEDGLHDALLAGDEAKIRARLNKEATRGASTPKNVENGVWTLSHLMFKG